MLIQFYQILSFMSVLFCNHSRLPNYPRPKVKLKQPCLSLTFAEGAAKVNKMVSYSICQNLPKSLSKDTNFSTNKKKGSPISNTFPLHFQHDITKKKNKIVSNIYRKQKKNSLISLVFLFAYISFYTFLPLKKHFSF